MDFTQHRLEELQDSDINNISTGWKLINKFLHYITAFSI